ncbi:hypothetical protein LCGC14_0582260 [marine sediment metagenome]|uniref:Uncharacterized protein n=1 Tax=marine sediment metagenome TaxID=412755 RepID=A0A0F9U299_9ZZZZ
MGGMGTGGYARGHHAIAHCKRCGNKVLRRHLVFDGHFPDLLVCTDCFDPKHPQDYLPDIHDPETIYKPTGDLDKAAANTLVVSFPPWKFIYGADYPTTSSGRPLNLTPTFKVPGLVTLGLDDNNKFTINGGGVTDA